MEGLLNGQQIKDIGLIGDATETSFRAAGYDVRVGKLISKDGELVDSYIIPAGGVVEVVSEEHVTIPGDISGYAFVKTSLCNEGVLALNIGIIDPGYAGKLSSALVNFGQGPRLISAGDVFLRLTFHKIDNTGKAPGSWGDIEYIKDKKQKVLTNFSSGSFLNIDELVDRATTATIQKWRTQVFIWIPAVAIGLALITFLLNFGALWSIQRVFQPSDNARAEIFREDLDRKNTDLDGLRKVIDGRIGELQAAVWRLEHDGSQTEPAALLIRRLDALEAGIKQLSDELASAGTRRKPTGR
jgi:dUTPase